MKKFSTKLLAAVVTSSLIVTPVMAAPSTESIEQEKAAAQSEAASLKSQLTEVVTQINQIEEDLTEKGEQIIQTTADLEEAEETEKQQYEDMKLRIKYMYEEGNTTFVEKLLTADSISELLNQADFVQSVHSYDRKMLQEYVDTKQQIADLKATLETEMANMEQLQDDYEGEKQNLNATIETHRANVADFDVQLQAAVQAAAEAAAQREAELQASVNEITGGQNNGNTGGQSGNVGGSGQNSNGNTSVTPPQGGSGDTTGGVEQTPSVPEIPQQPEQPQQPQQPVTPPVGDTSVGQAIVNVAYGYLGIPYVWGGTTTAGFDCSGMVQAAHAAAGISIPRVSWDQGAAGVEVSASEALPGDIVYYGWHVGIYIGNGQMIHAPEEGDVVKISTVDWAAHTFVRCW